MAIREHKDASEAERAIALCNAGPMAIAGRRALALLEAIGSNNAAGEFYLTDIVELAAARGLRRVDAARASEEEVMGVNDRVQLAAAEAQMQQRPARAGDARGRDADRAGDGVLSRMTRRSAATS